MLEKSYHHGNLKKCLIETGIELINTEGEKNLSLRKIASICGVSHSAPYAHFKSKEELIEAMQEYVTEKFTKVLEKSIEGLEHDYDSKVIIELGKAYVMFFYENPNYYKFLFSQPCVKINLTMNDDGENNYQPFEILRKTTFRIFEKLNMDKDTIKDAVISQWAMVHGLAGITSMKNVIYDENWENKIEDIIWNK